MIKLAGICRKSPGSEDQKVEDSINFQKSMIIEWCTEKYGTDFSIEWFADKGVSGDDYNRPELLRLFASVNDFDCAVAYSVDRYIRDPMGIVWFKQYFYSGSRNPHKGCKLRIISESDMYDAEDFVIFGNYLSFMLLCILADLDLMGRRRRQAQGIAKKRKELTSEQWRILYPGRKEGSKNKKKAK